MLTLNLILFYHSGLFHGQLLLQSLLLSGLFHGRLATTVAAKTFPFFLVFNAKKLTRTAQNRFGLNRFLVRSELY